MMQIAQADKYRHKIITLLKRERLLAELQVPLDNFFAAMVDNELAGVAGLEVYGKYGFLRSLAVEKVFRSQGIAAALLKHIEQLAGDKQLLEIYLLTETAPGYFHLRGYHQISRAEVPAEIQQSVEFSYACPQSAIVMRKSIILTKNLK